MTELRHGSNVAGLQTEAMLDVAADEWVVHTPDEGAIKVRATNLMQSSHAGQPLMHSILLLQSNDAAADGDTAVQTVS